MNKELRCPSCNNKVTVGEDFKHEVICNLCGQKMK